MDTSGFMSGLLCALGVLCGCLLPAPMAAAEEPPTFSGKPVVMRDGDTVRITFAVSAPTDVEAAILDSRGAVVRHLVAGALGRNPPPPLKVDSLAQELTWDGTDDRGRAATGGPFKVRVRLGLAPALQGLIGFDPSIPGIVRGVAVGPGGEVFALHTYGSHHEGDASGGICVFSREGKYRRTVVPYPANLADERLRGLKRIAREDGAKVPFVYQVENRSFVPGLGDVPAQRPVATRDGRLAFVGIQEGPRFAANVDEARLTVLATDGGTPTGGVLRTLVSRATDTGVSLALSPDEKTLYAARLRVGAQPVEPYDEAPAGYNYSETWRWTKPMHAVYRFGWDDAEMKVFVGEEKQAGTGANGLNTPNGVATDGEGNVYVADGGNQRIAVFSPAGRFLGEIPVQDPQHVEVHRRTGAVYVLCGTKDITLVKFDGYRSGKEVARRLVDRRPWALFPTRQPVMALDDAVEPAVLWLSHPFARVEDRGESFSDPVALGRPPGQNQPGSIDSVQEMSCDRRRGLLYVNNYWRFTIGTGQWERLPAIPRASGMWPRSNPNSAAGDVGRDGNYYVNLGGNLRAIARFGPDLKQRPFPNSNCWYDQGWLAIPCRNRGNGQTADADGSVYALLKKGGDDPADFHRAHALYVYGPDGQVKNDRLIDTSIPSVNSVRLDPAGNIYLAVGLRPGSDWLPPGLAGQVPEAAEDPQAVNGVNGYPLIYGSIIKFGPEGGAIRDGIGGTPCTYGHGRRIEVRGAKWIVSGASPVISWATPKRAPGTINICLCESTRFDVDDFGRSFFPDAARSRVGVLDTNGNVIGWFGAYGNADSAGPASAAPVPAIPLCWPQAVAVGEDAVYVGDRINRRIVAVRLDHTAEARCDVP